MTYSEVAPIVPHKEQVIAEKIPVREIEVERSAEQAPPKKRVSYVGWMVAAAALLIVAWILDRGAAKQRHDESLQHSSDPEIASQHFAAPFNSTDTPPAKSVKDAQTDKYLCWLPTDRSAQPSGWQDNEPGRVMQLRFLWSSYDNAVSFGVKGFPKG